jgi:hypothetical protein
MDGERRHRNRRSEFERRLKAGAQTDVTRIEHENLYNQVMDNVRTLARIEAELVVIRTMIEQLSRERFKDPSLA